MQAIVERRGPEACAGAWRHLRAATVSLVALGLAVGGHLYGGGSAPSAGSFLGVWALAALTCWHLSRRRWTVRSLAGALVLVQAAMHVVCSGQSGAGMMAAGMHTNGAGMLVAHLVATGVSVAVLRYGEATTWALVDALLLRPVDAATTVACPPARRPGSTVRAWRDARAVTAGRLIRSDPLRGPPAVA